MNVRDRRDVLLLEPMVFSDAHGFVVTSESAEVLYKTTDYYAPEHERTLLWSDAALGIQWPLAGAPVVADKDKAGKVLQDSEVYS